MIMPLQKGKSQEAFKHNFLTEEHLGVPKKQALAIAYSKQREGKKDMVSNFGQPHKELGHMGMSNGEKEELRKKNDMRYKSFY